MPSLPGTLVVRGLAVRCIIGARDWERRTKQRVVLDLEMDADLGPAAASDDLADAVDYKRIKDAVRDHVAASSFQMLEALAASVADLVLRDERLTRCKVTLDKPGALRHARSVAVVLERRR